MTEKGSALPCPACGYYPETAPGAALYLAPGTLLAGKYLIGRVLGQGGFGITYLARDQNLEIRIAVKEFFPQGLVSRVPGANAVVSYTGAVKDQFSFGVESFLREAKTLARFEHHPNIVTVRDFFKTNNTAYMVMSYIEGLTLEQYLDQIGGRLPYDKAVDIIMPVMDALKEVHAVGVMHRDISPDNIFIDSNGKVVLIDFGAARQEIKENSKSITAILKAGYAPEEQYRKRGRQGPWTDVYAVGATLYRMMCGESPPEAIDRLVEDTIVAPSKQGVNLNSDQEESLLKALAVSQKDRYPTIDDFQNTLLGRLVITTEETVENVFNGDKENNADARKGNSSVLTPAVKPLKDSGESLIEVVGSSAHGEEQKESKELKSETSIPQRKAKVVAISAIGFLVLFIAAIISFSNFGENEADKDDSFGFTNQLEEDTMIALPEADEVSSSRGNTVGNIINAGYVAKQDNYIYYHNDQHGGRIYSYNSDNNQSKQLNDYSSWSINIYGDRIYYSNRDRGYRIYSLKADGSEQKRLNDDYSSNINVVDGWIYYRNWDDGESVYRIRHNGGERTKINSDSSWHINVVGDWIYYRNQDDGNRIYKVRLDGSDRRRLNSDSSWFVNVVDNHIYYCNEDDGWQIFRLDTDGTNKVRLNYDRSRFLNVVGGWIYYVNRSDGNKIYRIDLDGDNRSKVNEDDSCCINVVGDWIYYKNMNDAEKLYRIKIDGSNREVVI